MRAAGQTEQRGEGGERRGGGQQVVCKHDGRDERRRDFLRVSGMGQDVVLHVLAEGAEDLCVRQFFL